MKLDRITAVRSFLNDIRDAMLFLGILQDLKAINRLLFFITSIHKSYLLKRVFDNGIFLVTKNHLFRVLYCNVVALVHIFVDTAPSTVHPRPSLFLMTASICYFFQRTYTVLRILIYLSGWARALRSLFGRALNIRLRFCSPI